MTKPKLHTVGGGDNNVALTVPDAADIEALWFDPKLGDGIIDVSLHSVAVGKPKDFFRTVVDPAYRRRAELYTHKPEGVIDEQHYIIARPMRKKIEEARPCTLVTVVYRDGTPRLWPIPFPRDGERDNEAWISARAAAKIAMEKWVKLLWARRATRRAMRCRATHPSRTLASCRRSMILFDWRLARTASSATINTQSIASCLAAAE